MHAFSLRFFPKTTLALALAVVASTIGCVGQLGASGTLNASGVVVGTAPPPPAGEASFRGDARASVDVRIQFFGVPLDGANDVVFVLDRSGSMSLVSAGLSGRDMGMSQTGSVFAGLGASVANAAAGGPMPSKMEAAKAELERVLSELPDGTRFNVIFFDDEVTALSATMMVMEPSTRASSISFVRGIDEGGSTAAVPALQAAYACGARRVVLLSDGLANRGGNGGELLVEARSAMGQGVRFDTVGLGIDQDASLLQTLAAESGGVAVMR